MRAGGIIVLGGKCVSNIYKGQVEQTVLVCPAPFKVDSPHAQPSKGSFNLVTDDRNSNVHTTVSQYLEIRLIFQVLDAGWIEVGYKHQHESAYKPQFNVLWWKLPTGDSRILVPSTTLEKMVVYGVNGQFGLTI